MQYLLNVFKNIITFQLFCLSWIIFVFTYWLLSLFNSFLHFQDFIICWSSYNLMILHCPFIFVNKELGWLFGTRVLSCYLSIEWESWLWFWYSDRIHLSSQLLCGVQWGEVGSAVNVKSVPLRADVCASHLGLGRAALISLLDPIPKIQNHTQGCSNSCISLGGVSTSHLLFFFL